MNEPLREYTGSWEEVATHAADLRGHQVKLTVLDGSAQMLTNETANLVIPQRPEPTPEQARLGIIPAATGNGTGADIMRFVQTLRQETTANDGEELWKAIAENRTMRRQLVEECE